MKVIKCLFAALLIVAGLNASCQTVASWKVTDVKKYIDSSQSILVVNFWATFCKPCVEELPYMQSVVEKYKPQHVNLFLVSLDLPDQFPDKIAAFAKLKGYQMPIVWLDETNADYFCPKIDKAWDGSIPCTLLVNNKKAYHHFIDHQMTAKEFEEEVKKAL